MAGNAKTESFMLSDATVMLGPVDKLWEMTPETHSVGLVKNFTATSDPAYTELTQGVKNTTVYSVMTSNPVKATAEVYEYTAANLAYGLGLNGASLTPKTGSTTVATAIAAPAPPAVTATAVVVADTANFTVGDYAFFYYGADDQVAVRRITAVDAGTDTLTVNVGFAHAIPLGTVVKAVQVIGIGSKENQPFLGCKVVGKLANGETVILLYPKVRIVKGFELAFKTDNFGFMPWELTVYDLVSTDANYALTQAQGQSNALLLTPDA